MFEFCIDMCIFLSQNKDYIAAVHCKAGKGRTGVMICCYLLFSGLAKSANDAFNLYALRRSHLNKVKLIKL